MHFTDVITDKNYIAKGTHNFLKCKLLGMVKDGPIQSYTRTPIKVEPLTITASKITEQIAPSGFERCTLHQISNNICFSQLCIATRTVWNNLNTIQTHGNVRTLGIPQFFANFKPFKKPCVRLFSNIYIITNFTHIYVYRYWTYASIDLIGNIQKNNIKNNLVY